MIFWSRPSRPKVNRDLAQKKLTLGHATLLIIGDALVPTDVRGKDPSREDSFNEGNSNISLTGTIDALV